MAIKREYGDEDIFEMFTDTAERLGFSRFQLRLMCQRGEFPRPIRFGRRRLVFRRSSVLEWIRQREERDWQEHEIGKEKRRAG